MAGCSACDREIMKARPGGQLIGRPCSSRACQTEVEAGRARRGVGQLVGTVVLTVGTLPYSTGDQGGNTTNYISGYLTVWTASVLDS